MCIPCAYTFVYHVTLDSGHRPLRNVLFQTLLQDIVLYERWIILTNRRVQPTSHLENSDDMIFRCWIFVAALLREVARRSRDGGSLSLMKFHSLSQLRWQLPRRRSPLSLSPPASRCGSDSPPDVHSLPSRRFATLQQVEAWIISADFKFNHEIYVPFSLPWLLGEVTSADCAEVGGVKLKLLNSLQNPSVGYACPAPLKGSQVDFLLTFGSMWASTPTECAFSELCRRIPTSTKCALF